MKKKTFKNFFPYWFFSALLITVISTGAAFYHLAASVVFLITSGSLLMFHITYKVYTIFRDDLNEEKKRAENLDFQLHRAQEKLKEVSAKYQILMEATPCTISWISSDLLYRGANKKLEEYLGIPEEALIGQHVGFLGGNPKYTEFVSQVFASQKTQITKEVAFLNRNGEERVLLLIAQKFDNNGLEATVIGIDITDQKKSTQLAHEKRLAEDSARVKSDFLSSMSHEIRTPINAVIGMTELLLDTQLKQKQKELVQYIKTSGDHLLGVINDILDFSKIDAGKLILENEPFDLVHCLEEVIGLLSLKAQENGIPLKFHISNPKLRWIYGDIIRLRQILVNLLSNAIKFTHNGEIAITVSTRPSQNGNIEIEFNVRDSGIGIPQEAIGRLFQSFSQAESDTTKKYGGTGLGLAICKNLSALMGGRIWVESQLNVGSVFSFTINTKIVPEEVVKKLNSENQEDNQISLEKLPPLKILLAEDNLMNQKVAQGLLHKIGYEITIANNGKEAVQCYKKSPYDLVFMDVHMPEMDGLEASRKIRELSPSKTNPWIIALTASISPKAQDLCVNAGMNDFVTKPVKSQDLVEAIMKLVHSGTQAQETSTPNSPQVVELSPTPPKKDEPAQDTKRSKVLSRKELLACFENDNELLENICQIFLESYSPRLEAIETSIAKKDFELLAREAHTLKGEVSQYATGYIVDLAFQLENMGKSQTTEGAQETFEILKEKVETLVLKISSYLQNSAA